MVVFDTIKIPNLFGAVTMEIPQGLWCIQKLSDGENIFFAKEGENKLKTKDKITHTFLYKKRIDQS